MCLKLFVLRIRSQTGPTGKRPQERTQKATAAWQTDFLADILRDILQMLYPSGCDMVWEVNVTYQGNVLGLRAREVISMTVWSTDNNVPKLILPLAVEHNLAITKLLKLN